MTGHKSTAGLSGTRLAVIVMVNLIVLVGLVLSLEGLSSVGLYFMDARPSTLDQDLPYVDPYTGERTRQATIGNVHLGERWAPNSLADFYYANDNWESPQGLYTDSYGFIHNGDPYRDLRSEIKSGERVFLFGGSSVAGANSTTSNDRNIAAFMERAIRSSLSPETQVVNAGFNGYESFRELIFAAHLIGEFEIDVMIFLDGRNDWYKLTASEHFHRNYYPESEALREKLTGGRQSSGFLKSLAMVNLVGLIKHRIANPAPATRHPTLNIIVGDNSLPNDAFMVDPSALFAPGPIYGTKRRKLSYRPEAVSNYIDNIRSIAGLCIAHKKHCIIALQPTLGYGDRELAKEEELYLERIPFQNWIAAQKAFYDEARRQFVGLSQEFKGTGVDFIDLTGLFDESDGRIFLDSIHYLDNGNCLLGAALGAQVAFGDWTQYRRIWDDCEK